MTEPGATWTCEAGPQAPEHLGTALGAPGVGKEKRCWLMGCTALPQWVKSKLPRSPEGAVQAGGAPLPQGPEEKDFGCIFCSRDEDTFPGA